MKRVLVLALLFCGCVDDQPSGSARFVESHPCKVIDGAYIHFDVEGCRHSMAVGGRMPKGEIWIETDTGRADVTLKMTVDEWKLWIKRIEQTMYNVDRDHKEWKREDI